MPEDYYDQTKTISQVAPNHGRSWTVADNVKLQNMFDNGNNIFEIADFFSFDKRLVFVAYTKSVRFLIGKKWGDNFVFRFSIWDYTEPEEIAIAEALGLPIYTAVECFTNESKREKCLCADCSTCFKCFNNKFNRLVCEIH